MRVTFFEENETKSYEITAAHYLEIQKSISAGEAIDFGMYPYEREVLEKIVGVKGSKQKSKSDIDYEACDYDAHL